jgi:hypothetical protein
MTTRKLASVCAANPTRTQRGPIRYELGVQASCASM